jgi:hypothetical protein
MRALTRACCVCVWCDSHRYAAARVVRPGKEGKIYVSLDVSKLGLHWATNKGQRAKFFAVWRKQFEVGGRY